MNPKKPVYRICAVSRETYLVDDLFRIVKTKDGSIYFDKNHSIKGRGAYLSKKLKIILEAQKRKILNKALRCNVDDSIYIELITNL